MAEMGVDGEGARLFLECRINDAGHLLLHGFTGHAGHVGRFPLDGFQGR